MSEPGTDQHHSRISIWKAADHSGSTANLFHDPFKTVICPQTAPVFIWEVHICQRFLHTVFYKIYDPFQLHNLQFSDHKRHLLPSGFFIFLSMNCLKHCHDIMKMFPRTHRKSISIPVYNAALPFGLGEEIADDLIQSQTFIRNDQPHSFEASFFQVTQEITPGFLIFPAAFRNAKNFAVSPIVHSDRDQNRNVLNLSAPTSLQINSIDKNIRMFQLRFRL